MASIGTNYDPTSTAQALAESFTASRQTILQRQSESASATQKALGTLGSALSTFQTSLASLTGLNKTVAASSAVFSDASVGSAVAKPTAAAGTYSFFVEQLASAHKLSFSGMQDITVGAENEELMFQSGKPGAPVDAFPVVLEKGKTYTVRDLATAINGAAGNTNVAASVVTGTDIDGNPFSELVLTSKLTGAANGIMLKPGTGAAYLAMNAAKDEVAPAQDAIVHIGAHGGTATYSATNTFNVIDDVTMTVSKAQAAGSAPVTLTVGADASKTTANVQAFVDAYNNLKTSIDALVKPGSPSSGGTAGAFAGDSGVRVLRDRLVALVSASGASSLAEFGITNSRQGKLVVDNVRLTKAMAANPTGLDTLIGSSADSAPSGIAGKLNAYVNAWTDSAKGQIGSRKAAVTKLQDSLTDRQTYLDKQYDSAYIRYLAQFTKLQSIQSSMSYNTTLFDAMFSSDKD